MSRNTSRMSLCAKRSRLGLAVLATVLGAALVPAAVMAQVPPRQPVDTGVRNALPSHPMGTVHEAGMQGMQGMQGMKGMKHTSGMAGMSEMSDSAMPSATQLLMDLMTDRVIRQRIMSDSILTRLAEQTMESMTPAQRDHMRLMMDEAEQPSSSASPAAQDAGHAATRSTSPAARVVTPSKAKAVAPAKKRTPAAAKPKPAPATTKPAPKKMPRMPGMPSMDHSNMPGMGKPTGKP